MSGAMQARSCACSRRGLPPLHQLLLQQQRKRVATTAARAAAASPAARPSTHRRRLLYDGIALDMDGTLTACNIDFVDMRQRTNIPVGDLFVAMESWEEEAAIKASMDVILEIEAAAAAGMSAKEGLLELLALLRDSEVKVALVTRNTTYSVDKFFELVGDQWRSLFDEIRTREFAYVKPDKRLLLELAQAWGIHPGKLLMVGDSHEDVECGNAAGAATCLIAGGGNEVGAAAAGPPPGAVPTLAVRGLPELTQRLLASAPDSATLAAAAAAAAAGGSSDAELALASVDGDSVPLLGWSLRSMASSSSSSESEDEGDAQVAGQLLPLDPRTPGAPAPGLDFFDALVELGAITTATTSFPRMGAAAGGLAACEQGGGDSVVHVGCGDGSLTKMLASKGLRVWGTDVDVAAATMRGLRCVPLSSSSSSGRLGAGALAGAVEAVPRGGVDAVLAFTPAASGSSNRGVLLADTSCMTQEAAAELRTLLRQGGQLCLELPLHAGADAAEEQARLRAALAAAGFGSITCLQLLTTQVGAPRVRLVAAVC